MLELSPLLKSHFPNTPDLFDQLLNWPGQVFREVKNRRTIRFEVGKQFFFLKAHRGIGWKEIFKSLAYGNLPVVSARTEYEAILALQQIGISTLKVAGFGERGRNPATLESFLITEELPGMVNLSEIHKKWVKLPSAQQRLLRHCFIKAVAGLARKLHRHGLNHRDFYLCHFLVEEREWAAARWGDPPDLYLIDLHRMQQRAHTPIRWILKDLSGLFFSAMHLELTVKEMLLFIREYKARPARLELMENAHLWRKMLHKAIKMYSRYYGQNPVLPKGFMKAED